MKICIFSTYSWLKKHNNYGTLLQYYSLQEYLKKIGHKAEWIRYNPIAQNLKRAYFKYYLEKILHPIELANRVVKKLIIAFNSDIEQLKKHCRTQFEYFMKEHVNTSEIEYNSWKSIKDNPPIADLYIAGSDQIWSYTGEANFLDFAPESKKRCSYASSFGRAKPTESNIAFIASKLKKFHKVSVREKEGVEICAKAGRNDAIQVADPTLLLKKSEYMNMICNVSVPISGSYVFCYFLNVKKKNQIYWNEIKKFSNNSSLDLKVVPIQGAEYTFPLSNTIMPSPLEWLAYIARCECVITNSFHGTLFAIIMQKPFLVILQSGATSEQNCRFLSILEMFGLESRIYNPEKEILEKQMAVHINWDKVLEKQNELRAVSEEYIMACL